MNRTIETTKKVQLGLEGKVLQLNEITPKLTFHYKCGSSKCEFPMPTLKESSELKAVGIKATSEVIVETIDHNQQLFTSRECGGYILQAGGNSLVLLQKDSVIPNDETIFRFH